MLRNMGSVIFEQPLAVDQQQTPIDGLADSGYVDR